MNHLTKSGNNIINVGFWGVICDSDIKHRQIFHSSDELFGVTAQPRKVNLKNEKSGCHFRSVKRCLMSNSVNNDIIICSFQHRNRINLGVYE